MNIQRNRLIKSGTAFILVLAIIVGMRFLSVNAAISTEQQIIDTVKQPGVSANIPTNTPRPEVMLLSEEITPESVAVSNQLYNNILNCDPTLFLLTDEGIKRLGWCETATDEELAYLENIAFSITEDCSSTNEKIFAVVKYIAQNVGYDYDYYTHGAYDYMQLALSPWDVLNVGATVCEGYARTTAALLQILDIPCIMSDSPNHKWNMVYNGEYWMLIDTTWISTSIYEYGVLTKSDDLFMAWYDFTIEQANADYNHLIEDTALSVIDGVLYTFPSYTEKKHVVIPANVQSINKYAYITDEDCVIETVYLPKSVEDIGECAFYFGNTLKTIYYQGTSSDFAKITVNKWNNDFTDCTDIRYLDEVSAPYIKKQPADQYTGVDVSITLSAEAYSDTGTITYQWYECTNRSNTTGTPVAGAVNDSLTIVPDTTGKKYYYLEVTVVDPSVTGVNKKTVKTVPCKVHTFEDAEVYRTRIGYDAVMYTLDESKIIYIDGSGDIENGSYVYLYNYTVYVDKDITSGLNELDGLSYANKFVVENGSEKYRSDEVGALYDIVECALLAAPNNSSVTDYKVLDGTKIIYEDAIGELEYISLPASLETIQGKLVGNNYLRGITVDEKNTNFYVDAYGALIDKTGKRIVVYPAQKDIADEYIVPDGIQYIEDCAFMRAKIKSVKFNDDLVSIGNDAFFNSNYLTRLVFPASLNRIGYSAFSYNQNLTDVFFKGDVPEEWGANVFKTWEDIDPVTIHYAKNASGWSTPQWIDPADGTGYDAVPFDLAIYESGYACGDDAFWSYKDGELTIDGKGPMWNWSYSEKAPWDKHISDIKKIKIGHGITSIGDYAFNNHYYVADIKLPESMKKIGDNAFGGTRSLESIVIPENVDYIGDYAFSNSGVKDVYFVGDVPGDFGQYVFRDPRYYKITIYYQPNKGYSWTSPTWTGADNREYSTATFTPGEEAYDLSGQITSYNPGTSITIQLMQSGEVKYTSTIAAKEGNGKVTQQFTISDIAVGRYDLVISKIGHFTYTITGIEVSDKDVDLTQSSKDYSNIMLFIVGDANYDGKADSSDAVAILRKLAGYEINVFYAHAADVNGDGKADSSDAVAILRKLAGY